MTDPTYNPGAAAQGISSEAAQMLNNFWPEASNTIRNLKLVKIFPVTTFWLENGCFSHPKPPKCNSVLLNGSSPPPTPTTGEGGTYWFQCGSRWSCHDRFVPTISLEPVGGIPPNLPGYIIGPSLRAD